MGSEKKGVAGRDAIVHKTQFTKGDAIVHARQRNSSHKELVARHESPCFPEFRGATIAQ